VMGRIKQVVIMYRDITGNDGKTPDLRDLDYYIEITGGRVGLTDEQLREVAEDE